jgi:predicted branched-subunit amino acid permease
VIPAFFTAMLVSLWESPRKALPWVVGGVVAALAELTLGGFWYVALGAVAGSAVAGFTDD